MSRLLFRVDGACRWFFPTRRRGWTPSFSRSTTGWKRFGRRPRAFPAKILKDYRDRLDVSWIFHDNALEGVVLSFAELKAAIDQRIISDVTLHPDV